MSRFLEKLKEYPSDLTLSELIVKLEEVNKEELDKEEKLFESIKLKYKNSYLKRFNDKSIFGKTLEVFNIIEITDKSRTTDWKFVYFVKGTRISFCKRDLYINDLKGNRVDETFTQKQLSEMTKISEIEYMEYLKEFNNITNRLKSLIK